MDKQWKTNELKLLESLANTFNGKHWKSVSKHLEKEGFFRTQVECRYKWVNYIAPGINSNPWSQNQLVKLFDQYKIHKSQWTLIQRSLNGRTQIKIRNQFYGTIRNVLRFSIKYFKAANGRWSLISNQVKPQVLVNLYDGIDQFQFVGDLVRTAIEQMEYKFNKATLISIIKENESIFRKMVITITDNKEFLIKEKLNKEPQNRAEHSQEHQLNEISPENNQNIHITRDPIPHVQDQQNNLSVIKMPFPQENRQNIRFPNFYQSYYPYNPYMFTENFTFPQPFNQQFTQYHNSYVMNPYTFSYPSNN